MCGFPLGLPALEQRMCDEQMPDHRLKGLRMRCHSIGIDGRHNHDGVADFRGVATVSADDTKHLRPNLLGVLQGTDEIWTDVLYEVAAADRKDEQRVNRLEPADLQPFSEHCFPAFVIGP